MSQGATGACDSHRVVSLRNSTGCGYSQGRSPCSTCGKYYVSLAERSCRTRGRDCRRQGHRPCKPVQAVEVDCRSARISGLNRQLVWISHDAEVGGTCYGDNNFRRMREQPTRPCHNDRIRACSRCVGCGDSECRGR